MFLDGGLLPARLLLNGNSIVQDMTRRRVSYFHVELDRHDILLAEGAPAESYLDRHGLAGRGMAGSGGRRAEKRTADALGASGVARILRHSHLLPGTRLGATDARAMTDRLPRQVTRVE